MRLLRLILALASASAIAPAQTHTAPEVRQLWLQDCIELALRHNLDLQIDRYGPLVAFYTLRGDYGAYDPTLSVSGQHDHNESGSTLIAGGFAIPASLKDDNSFSSSLGGTLPWGTTYSLGTVNPINESYGSTGGSPFENSSAAVAGNLTQPLLKNFWIDRTRLTIRIDKNRLKYSQLALKLQIMMIATQVENAYYDLIYDRTNVVVQEKAVELAERLAMENRKKLEVGTMAPLDLQSAEAQAASSRAALLLARSTLANQEHLIKQLITENYSAWANTEVEPAATLAAPRQFFSLQDSWSKGLTQRPEMLQAKLDVEKTGIQLKFDKNQLFPELDLFGTYGYDGSGRVYSDALYEIQRTEQRFYTYGGKLTFPLANVTARNAYKSDKATLQQLLLTVKRWERDIMVELDNDIKTAQSNFDQVQATRAAREYEESALDAEQKKLDNGKSTTYTVLQVQRDLTNARGNEIQALDNYNKSLAQLSLDEGSTLERLNINLEAK